MRTLASTTAAALTAAALAVLAPAPAGAHPKPPTGPTRGPCAYTPMVDQTYSVPVALPPDPRHTPDRGTLGLSLKTNRGEIPLTLDRAKAPCTVQSIAHLARARFYDDTICHRLTTYPTLSVLQCGDPLGTGNGDPGYSFKDELPTDLAPWPGDTTGTRRVYPRGTLAMANAGPDTNGSQFFLVYQDSRLRPDYTVFGTVSERGMRVLDRIAAAGVEPTDPGAPLDGLPALRVEIDRAVLGHGRDGHDDHDRHDGRDD